MHRLSGAFSSKYSKRRRLRKRVSDFFAKMLPIRGTRIYFLPFTIQHLFPAILSIYRAKKPYSASRARITVTYRSNVFVV